MQNFSIFSNNFLPQDWPQDHLVISRSSAMDGNAKELLVRQNFFKNLQLKDHQLITCQQTHSANVVLVQNKNPEIYANTDGLISLAPNLALAVYSADCMPVFLSSRKAEIFGVVHAGWRGMRQKIVLHALKQMQQKCNIDPQDFLVHSAPHIQKCCYQVGPEMRSEFGPLCFTQKNSMLYLELKAALKEQLNSFDLPEQNYRAHPDCTYCTPGYYSFRRDKTEKRMISIIARSKP